jgi:hypothetical protein
MLINREIWPNLLRLSNRVVDKALCIGAGCGLVSQSVKAFLVLAVSLMSYLAQSGQLVHPKGAYRQVADGVSDVLFFHACRQMSCLLSDSEGLLFEPLLFFCLLSSHLVPISDSIWNHNLTWSFLAGYP